MANEPARIVVVEDNISDIYLLRHCIAGLGSPVDLTVLTDGEQAIDFFRTEAAYTEPVPCVILLDLHLPRWNGVEVLREICRQPKLSHVRVAIWTTLASPDEHAEALRLGANYYTIKPSTLEGFDKLATKLLELCAGESAIATTV